MKFVCDRCQTRYSIADEKVRQKILRIRCKTCANVIVVQDERLASSAASSSSSMPRSFADLPNVLPTTHPKPPPPPPPSIPDASHLAPLGGGVEWFVSIHGAQSGPFSRTEAAKRIAAAKAGSIIHVWKDGMSGWKPAGEVSVIARELSLLRRPSPSLPPPPPLPPPHPPTRLPGAPSLPTPSPLHPPAAPAKPFAKVGKSADTRTPSPRLPAMATPAPKSNLAQALAAEPLVGGEPETEFEEDPTTRKAQRVAKAPTPSPLASARAPSEKGKAPPVGHPLPPVLVKFSESDGEADLGPDADTAVSSPTLGTFSEMIHAAKASGVGDEESSADTETDALVLPVPAGYPPASSDGRPAKPTAVLGIFQRHQGLKYVVAAVGIVVLVILLVVLTLRGDAAKKVEHGTLVAKPEPLKLEEPKVEEPGEPSANAVEPEGRPSGTRSGWRRGISPAHSVARIGPRPGPTPEQEAAMRRMAKAPVQTVTPARPNPFSEGGKTVSQDQISAVVRNKNNQAGLKTCYERALKMDNHLTSGRIDVTVSIGMSGIVQRVVVEAPSSFLLIEPCIKTAVKRWVFPPSSEEYGTSFPLIMQGGM